MTQQVPRLFTVMRVVIGAALGSWLTAGVVHAGTVTIAATPSVVEEVEMVAQAFEAVYPNDRVQIAIASEDEWKSSAKRLPVQMIVSDNPSFVEWLEARDVAKRTSGGLAVHVPLAVVAAASTGEAIGSLRDLHARLRQPGTSVVILDPTNTECGRLAQALLKSLGVTAGSSERVMSAKHNTQVIEFVRTGKAQFGIVFAPEAVAANGVTIHAVSAPQFGVSVHDFAVKHGQQDHPVVKRFLAFAHSPEAKQVLKERGYDMLQAHPAEEGEVVVVAQRAIDRR